MREIKFRVWSKSHKLMKPPVILEYLIETTLPINVKIDDFIFMQYTGLKDKNGVQIYEGDILDSPYTNKSLNVVGFSEFDCSIAGSVSEALIVGFNVGGNNLFSDEQYEVIGNIYENPELLAQ